MISVLLSKEESELFLVFQQHHESFMILQNTGVFDIKNGSATLNFDSNGALLDVTCNVKLYKKGFPQVISLCSNN